MNWQALLNPDIQKFIIDHERDDVRQLALKKPPSADWPYRLVLEQISARAKARKKMPEWLDKGGIIFPPPDLIEQASSQGCAAYKARITGEGNRLVDLSAGTGADFMGMAEHFKHAIAIEQDLTAAQILIHNLSLMLPHKDAKFLSCLHSRAEDYVRTMDKADWVFIDPQRRSEARRGIYALKDCSPDITTLLPSLTNKAQRILLKTSPVLDISVAIAELSCVIAVHIVQYEGDCKELLFVLDPTRTDQIEPKKIPVHAVIINDTGEVLASHIFNHAEEEAAPCSYEAPQTYLYEPAPCLQKSGAYKSIAQKYGLKKIHPNTHLYTSNELIYNFPGRVFEITGQCPATKKDIKEHLPNGQASITVRNFPASPDELRKKLGLKDGGDYTVFACTLHTDHKALLICRKAGNN